MKPESNYTVADFMRKELVEVTPGTTARKCAEVMAAEHVSSAVITKDSRIAGIVTEKDLAKKIVAKGLDPNKVMVRDIMATDVVTIGPDATLYDAMVKLNRKRVKHLPVVKDDMVIGMITAMDILRTQPAYMEILLAKKGSDER